MLKVADTPAGRRLTQAGRLAACILFENSDLRHLDVLSWIGPMKIDLTDKTALITGSTAGIGLAIAKGLAASGAKVVVNGRKQATVDKGVAAVHDSVKAAAVSGVAADVSTAEGCDALVKAVPAVDILINNAGIFEPKPFFEIPMPTGRASSRRTSCRACACREPTCPACSNGTGVVSFSFRPSLR